MKLKINFVIIVLLGISLNTFCQSGVVNNGANLVIQNNVSFYLNGSADFINLDYADNQYGTVDLDGNIVLTGNWLNDLSHNIFINQNSSGTVFFNGASPQIIEGSAVNNFENVIVDNNQGIELNAEVSISYTLTLTRGNISLKKNNIKILEDAEIVGSFSNQKLILADGEGQIQKFFSTSSGSFLFPVGNNFGGNIFYTPVEITLNSASFSSGASINVSLKGEKLPANTSLDDYLNRYWTITQTNFTDINYNLLMYYDDADIIGDEQNIYGAKYDGSAMQKFDQVNTAENSITFIGLTDFSDFTGVEGDISVLSLNNSDVIKIFPNPGNGRFFIKFSNNSTIKNDAIIRIYSSEGVMVLNEKLSNRQRLTENNLYKFDLEKFAVGIYLVSVLNDNNIFTKKLIIN